MYFSNSKNQKHTYYYLIILFFAITLLLGCKQTQKTEKISYPLETAKVVSHVTSGMISSDEVIRVKFVQTIVGENLIDQPLKKKVFSFEPALDGLTIWKDKRTLIFKPNENLPLNESFSGSLNMQDLIPEHDEILKALDFQFSINARNISVVTSDFKLPNRNNPKNIIIEGTVILTEKTDFSILKNSTTLLLKSKNIPLKWNQKGDGKSFTFESENFTRTQKEMILSLKINKDKLELAQDYKKDFKLSALKKMEVIELNVEDTGKNPGLKFEFSDELNSEQDLSGLISIDNVSQLKLKKAGKYVTVTGSFEYGSEYTIKVNKGIMSKWGTKIEESFIRTIKFEDIKPQIKFSSNGVFLPSVNNKKILFQTINVKRVHVEIKRVFESNMGQFLQTEQLNSAKERNDNFGYSYVERVGIVVYNKELDISTDKNKWLQHELDLSNMVELDEKGLYLFEIRFKREDMLNGDIAELENDRRMRYYGNDYYSNPNSRGYLYQHGHIYKPVIISDIGLTYFKGNNQHVVFASNIIDASSINNASVKLKTYQNQLVSEKFTDANGKVEFNNISDNVFYIEVEKDGQHSIIKPNEMGWNLSTFNTGGEISKPDGLRAFIYTERGVYRPGDEINLSVIARNKDNTFPTDHPVTLKLYNPKNQLALERTNKKAEDGFYNFNFKTNDSDPTGNWRAELLIGSRKFNHILKIETVAPFRLKVNINPEKRKITWDDKYLSLELKSTYLFGNPASNLNAEVELTLDSYKKTFSKYKNFIFHNSQVDFKTIKTNIFKGKLNNDGVANIKWKLPTFDNVPSAIKSTISAKVLEKGGRPNLNAMSIPIEIYKYYVGVQKPESDYGYLQTSQIAKIPAIIVDNDGVAVSGRAINYKIYKGRRYWWWQYDSMNDYKLKFKTDTDTELYNEGIVISKNIPVNIDFTPDERGYYLIEMQDGNEDGHIASFFIGAYPWGDSPSTGKDEGTLVLKSDKQNYNPGDEATISFPAPNTGSILYSLVRGGEVLESRWFDTPKDPGETTIEIPITKNMAPTSYATVSIIQPHEQTLNDRPIRMYGVIPINVEDALTHQNLEIQMSDELESDKSFKVKIINKNQEQIQFTIAVVDEGLLDLTWFKTPDPWADFFKKLRMGVNVYDLFSFVIGANKGDIFKTFSIGGGMDDLEMNLSEEKEKGGKKKRFKPVTLFKGPLSTNEDGEAEVEFNMPNYIGSVRVMVIAAKGNSYGNVEKTVPVKKDLMVLPSLPRVLGPEDRIIIPVTVFAMKDGLGKVDVTLKTEGPVDIIGMKSKNITFNNSGDKDVYFELMAKAAVGFSKITISAKSKSMTTSVSIDLEVRASSPRLYETIDKIIEPGKSISLQLPNTGMPGSNKATISVQRRPNMDFGRRLQWLIRYPYGCIEQTVSSAFPQLYLKKFISGYVNPKDMERDIDKNINATIKRLRRFQLSSGAFAYWPGSTSPSIWGTSYAGYFLIESKRLGYHVPQDMITNWIRYEKSQARKTNDRLIERVFRVYLLALAGSSDVGALNLLKENNLKDMSDTEKWTLAAAYKLSGVENTANEIIKNTGTKVKDYSEFSGTYGSGLRDKAKILEKLILFEHWAESDNLAKEIAKSISSRNWYSTQTTSYVLLALGKYLEAVEGNKSETHKLSGYIKLPSGKKLDFDTESIGYKVDIEKDFGKNIEIYLDKESTINRAFIALNGSGIPLKANITDVSKNITLDVEWLDEDGMKINPNVLKQGKTIWGHFKVRNKNSYTTIDEVALVQMIPAGWEIENTRLSQESMPQWMRSYKLNREEFLDIRDDRIMWFFDIRGRAHDYDFVVKLNCVTVGTYVLPPTIVEAMYNNEYRAVKAGKQVKIVAGND